MKLTTAAPASLCAALALAVPLAAAPAAQEAAPKAAPAQERKAERPDERPLDLEDEIDASIRWLRSTQDEATGRYGSGVVDTAWVLHALAVSPRRYRRVDGPFVARALDWLAAGQRADGMIADASAMGPELLHQTALAAAALADYADDASRAVLVRALKPIGEQEAGRADGFELALPDGERALRELLAKRDAAGFWDGPQGRVRETARDVAALSAVFTREAKPAPAREAVALPRVEPADAAKVDAALQRGARYLLGAGQDGLFGAPGEPNAGLTAMALGALLCAPEPRSAELQHAIDHATGWLVSLQKPDGSIHDGALANYVTSASILAFVREKDPKLEPVIRRARDYLVRLQADEEEHYSPDDPYYGGIGYGDDERPDLSNLQEALEALAASGLGPDHPAFRRALTFLQRCQNRSESNDVRIVDGSATIQSGDDGGGVYLPGGSQAGEIELEDGTKVPRSYGSMSYALLKGYVLAGVPRDDPRMKAVWRWVCEHYTLDVNPGFESASDPTASYQGLYYYFLTMARALDLYGNDTVTDAAGVAQPWRKQLCGRLVAMQRRTDGSWINANSPRWWEGNPVLATSYAMLTLDAARP
jgi:hypothetical protein